MEKYSFIKEIGSGSFGKVFLVKSKQKGINYVVKQVDLNKLDRKQSQSASKEVEVLSKLRHNHIVSYKESYEKNNQLNIVLEYCENGDLYDKIKEKRMSNKFFGDNEILDYFVQICLALEYIHGQKILHRDLKTKNIFLTKGNVIKLGDFGIAKVLENSFELAQTCIGSPFYVSPEICESKPYSKKSDVWALGCVLYELTTLRYAFVAKNVKNLVTKILTGAYNPLPSNMNLQIRSLISSMLKPNPKDRPSVRELLEKRFLAKRRATLVGKPHERDRIKRSRSGDVSRNIPSVIFKNQIKSVELKQKKYSASCLQLNQNEDQRKFRHISDPESKYKPLNNHFWKWDKKFSTGVQNKNELNLNNFRSEKKEKSCPNSAELSPTRKNSRSEFTCKFDNKNSNLENLSIKLPKVDSEYYDLIAGHDRKDNIEKENNFVGKQIPRDKSDPKLKANQRPDSKWNMVGIAGIEGGEGMSISDVARQGKKEAFGASEAENEQRKRWLKNTLQKKTLLAILSDAELLEDSFNSTSEKPDPITSIDDLLTLKPSEVTQDVLLPIKLHEIDNKSRRENQFQILYHEIGQLREKFEMNDRHFQMDELMRLTEASKNILNLKPVHEFTGRDRKVEESVYYDLECRKVTLERIIGFCRFLQIYGQMIDIINELEFASSAGSFDGLKTYVISKMDVSGDGGDVIKNTWKSIISILDKEQEYLPDLWELAMSENIYYHL